MVDSIEIRLDQLTQAIKGLYAKSSMSQGEIYNALTSLSQRYENLTNISTEKIAATLTSEFRKTMETKYGQTNQYIKDLETNLKNFIQVISSQNPKMSAEISRLLSDTTNAYAKLNSQDLALQKIFDSIESVKNNSTPEEIIKLSENFMNFSRGFEGITVTLNKNFADFLTQLKQNSSKDELKNLKSDIDTISGNVNSVISAISIIDSKYKDLTGLISTVQKREDIFNNALKEVQTLNNSINSLKDDISAIDSKNEIQALNSELKNQIENVKYEIQKIINTAQNNDLKTEVYNLSNNINDFQNNINGLNSGLNNTKDELKNLSTTVQGLGNEVKNVHTLINDEILYKSHKNNEDFERYLNSAKEDIKSLLIGLTAFKNDLTAINQGNIKVLQEPIERALEQLKDKDIGKNIKELSDNLRDTTFEIQSSIQNMQASLNDMDSVSSIQILTQISEAIPTIADKLEIFRTHVVTENSANLGEIRTTFSETIVKIKEELSEAIAKIQDDTKTINIETSDNLKVDLQRLSDNLIDSIETLNDKVHKEFSDYKQDFEEQAIKQADNFDKLNNKLSNLEVGLENFSKDTIEKVSDTININSAHAQDVLNEIKSDILEGVSEFNKTNKNNLNQFELKIDKVLDNYIGADLDNIINKKSLRETVIDIETKIDRTNLQQIHNAKELLEEIQAASTNLSMKMSAIEESKNTATIINNVSKLSEKLQSIEEFNSELSQELETLKGQIEQKLKDNIQKISTLLEKYTQESKNNNQNLNFDELTNTVQEYLSNFEFLKSNISQEIKENLIGEFNKIENSIIKLRTNDDNPNYTYTMEDIESDLAKIRLSIEKNALNNEEFKNLFEKIIELRTVGLENVKLNRDIENSLTNITGWFKDATDKFDDLSDKIYDIQNIGFEDLKTRLIQSEKSKFSQSEFASKMEAAIKTIVKNQKVQDTTIQELGKKLTLLSQTQAESFNPSQFIEIFYENMTQTKMLSNRVEIIEDKINNIQNTLEKLIGYIEQ